MKPPRIWILVADGETARFYLAEGRTARLEPALPFEFRAPNPPAREQGTDRPGRVYESFGEAHHGVEPRTDLHREVKRKFAVEIADLLKTKARENVFDELVLIAPPKMMGDLRAALDERTRACVKTELAKDLTRLSPTELHTYLTAGVWS